MSDINGHFFNKNRWKNRLLTKHYWMHLEKFLFLLTEVPLDTGKLARSMPDACKTRIILVWDFNSDGVPFATNTGKAPNCINKKIKTNFPISHFLWTKRLKANQIWIWNNKVFNLIQPHLMGSLNKATWMIEINSSIMNSSF